MRLSMILGEHVASFDAQFLGTRGEALEKGARARFSSQEVKGFQDHARAALRRHHPHHGGNHGTVTMAPQDGALGAKRVEKSKCLQRRPAMKIKRELAANSSGASIAGAIGDENAMLARERRNLPAERINAVTPAAMKYDERAAAAKLPVMYGDRA